MLNNKEIQILQHIISYCDEVSGALNYFGNSEAEFRSNYIFRNTVCMSIQQIGELVKHLSFEFRQEYNGVIWKEFSGVRDMFAHSYQKIDFDVIWEAAHEDVVSLREYCCELLKQE